MRRVGLAWPLGYSQRGRVEFAAASSVDGGASRGVLAVPPRTGFSAGSLGTNRSRVRYDAPPPLSEGVFRVDACSAARRRRILNAARVVACGKRRRLMASP